MKWKNTNLQTRLYLITVIILLVGLGSAVLIYFTAANDSENVLGYEIMGGNVYSIKPEDSKRYMHDLELYGGKANVVANELTQWFVGLWHGKSLAFTIACITVFVSLVFFYVAYYLPPESKPEARDENSPDGDGSRS